MSVDRLSEEQIGAALADLPDWQRDEESLVRTRRFSDFVHAIDFVEEVAAVAEELQHHPDIDIRYNKVTLRLSTHSAGGLTARDVELAARLDAIR
jgi:4a-hydroxytetrahydrobiopterin dehydratase